MGKALVIKNADFSENKVATVEFLDIPCTGVSFASSSIELTGLGEATIEYSVTPANTTDDVILTSSDPSILTVSGTTVTAVGIGECTLTLTCGTFSDTCDVSVDIYEIPVIALGVLNQKTSGDKEGARLDSSVSPRFVCLAPYSDGYFDEQLPCYHKQFDWGEVTAIKIPQNTTKIHLYAKYAYQASNTNGTLYFTNADEIITVSSYDYLVFDSGVELVGASSGQGYNEVDQEIVVPSGATGFFISYRPDSTRTSALAGITTEADAVAFGTETLGLTIHYLNTPVN